MSVVDSPTADPDFSPEFLIIDDDPVFVSTLETILQRRGISTASAADAGGAIDVLDTCVPKRIVLDLKLGEDNGLQLLTELLQRLPDVEIVMLTAYSSIATAVRAVQLGARNYLCKPVDVDEILAAFDTPPVLPDAPRTPTPVKRLEWEQIQRVLAENSGNISATARALGMHRRTLQRKLLKRPSPPVDTGS